MRQLFKLLNGGGVVGILPDQQPKAGDGEFAPFFGVQALTMTLLGRLAQRTGATVLFAWCERIDTGDRDGPRFALHIEAAPADDRRSRSRAWRGRAQCRGRAHRPPRPGAIPVDLQALYAATAGLGGSHPVPRPRATGDLPLPDREPHA